MKRSFELVILKDKSYIVSSAQHHSETSVRTRMWQLLVFTFREGPFNLILVHLTITFKSYRYHIILVRTI